MIASAELRALEVAANQSSYLSRRQALACGMSETAIKRRLASGHWLKAKPGLYQIPGYPVTSRGLMSGAVACMNAVVSHQSAAEIHEFIGIKKGLAVVTVPIRTTNRFPGVTVHQSTDLAGEYITTVAGMPVTTVHRTVIDLAAIVGPKLLGKIIDRLVIEKRMTIESLAATHARLSRKGKPGTRRLRLVLEIRGSDFSLAESELELMVLRKLREWGFPEPELQYPLPWRTSRSGRVDLCYPHLRLIIEIDGRAWHTTIDSFDEDRTRDNLAQLAGWRTLRITYRMITQDPEGVRRLLEQALATSVA